MREALVAAPSTGDGGGVSHAMQAATAAEEAAVVSRVCPAGVDRRLAPCSGVWRLATKPAPLGSRDGGPALTPLNPIRDARFPVRVGQVPFIPLREQGHLESAELLL